MLPEDSPTNGEPVSQEVIQAEVLIYFEQEMLAKYSIEHGEYLVGRDPSCPVRIDVDGVSRYHARITFNDFELLIEDLASSNGIYIDGIQVRLPTRIRSNQEVQIGSARVFFQLREAARRQLAAALWDKDLGLEQVRTLLEGEKYRIITTIARGGMGVVMQARDLRIRRMVAMKVMRTNQQFSRENVLRFIDEAQLTGQLDHPNIVPVYEVGVDGSGEIFYTMKYVKGITLDDVLRGLRHGRANIVEKYNLTALLTVFQKICDAVAFAHSKGVVHRDLKPENVMIGSYGEVLVMDWGLAKNTTGAQRSGSVETVTKPLPRDEFRGFETMHGLIVGTPPYISPDQARGELDLIDGRSDIYVLGAILYCILTLRVPVGGTTVAEVVDNILSSRITPPVVFNQQSKSGRRLPASTKEEEHLDLVHLPGKRVPEGLSSVVMKAMHVDPAHRYQSVEEMQDDLAACQGGFAPKAEGAGLGKQMLLWAERHQREVSLGVIAFFVLCGVVATFIYQLAGERNRALENQRRAITSERLAASRLAELRGTAPVYAAEAKSLLEDQRLDDALDKINYAIAQVPNDAEFRALRGNILQALLRFDEAVDSYEEALQRDPNHHGAQLNLELTKKIIASIGEDGRITPPILRTLHGSLVSQKRVDEALAVLSEIGKDKDLFFKTWKAAFAKRGLRQRFSASDDETIQVDFSRVALPDLRKLRDAPVSGLNLDDTQLPEISLLKDLKLRTLSLNRTLVSDLSPLEGMPLKFLSLEGTRVTDLRPLSGMPLENLRLNNTRINNLAPLQGMKLEELSLAGCRQVKDLGPLTGLPLQRLDLSRTTVTDLKPLTQSPLRELNLENCADLVDLTPLMEMTTLESVEIPSQCRDIAYLRNHPSLKRLSYKKLTQPVSEFWQEFDAAPKSQQ